MTEVEIRLCHFTVVGGEKARVGTYAGGGSPSF